MGNDELEATSLMLAEKRFFGEGALSICCAQFVFGLKCLF